MNTKDYLTEYKEDPNQFRSVFDINTGSQLQKHDVYCEQCKMHHTHTVDPLMQRLDSIVNAISGLSSNIFNHEERDRKDRRETNMALQAILHELEVLTEPQKKMDALNK